MSATWLSFKIPGESLLSAAGKDPAIRAEIERQNQHAREALLCYLVRLEKYYRRVVEPEAANWEAAVGRNLILNMIPITRENLERGSSTLVEQWKLLRFGDCMSGSA